MYHLLKDGQPVGPFSLEDLIAKKEAGELSEDKMVWRQGSPKWVEARHIRGLYPPPPLFTNKVKESKALIITVVVLFAGSILLGLANVGVPWFEQWQAEQARSVTKSSEPKGDPKKTKAAWDSMQEILNDYNLGNASSGGLSRCAFRYSQIDLQGVDANLVKHITNTIAFLQLGSSCFQEIEAAVEKDNESSKVFTALGGLVGALLSDDEYSQAGMALGGLAAGGLAEWGKDERMKKILEEHKTQIDAFRAAGERVFSDETNLAKFLSSRYDTPFIDIKPQGL